jgi:hypothetical protein
VGKTKRKSYDVILVLARKFFVDKRYDLTRLGVKCFLRGSFRRVFHVLHVDALAVNEVMLVAPSWIAPLGQGVDAAARGKLPLRPWRRCMNGPRGPAGWLAGRLVFNTTPS